jgi:anti-anti-sigma regulatory factor
MTDTEPVTPAQPQPVIVTLPAEIDTANADSVCTQITAKFASGARVVIADMTATTFCDTSGTRALVLACRHAWLAAAPRGGPGVPQRQHRRAARARQ